MNISNQSSDYLNGSTVCTTLHNKNVMIASLFPKQLSFLILEK